MIGVRFLELSVSISIQACLLIVVTQLLTQWFRADRVRDRLWSICQVSLLLMAFADVTLPHIRIIPALWAGRWVALDDIDQWIAVGSLLGSNLLWVWCIGAGMSFVILILGTLRAYHILMASAPIVSLETPRAIEAPRALDSLLHNSIVGKRNVRFLVSDHLRSPFCWQIHRPAIVLPRVLLSFPADEMVPILKHELTHLRARHPLQLFLQRFVEIVYWFHPAVWWASRQAIRYREFVCDHASVSSRAETASYLRALVRLMSRGAVPLGLNPIGLAFGGPRGLTRERADRLAQGNTASKDLQQGGVLSLFPALVAITLMLLGWVPLNPTATARSIWSPWPGWSAQALHIVGFEPRDYEIDAHRFHSRHDAVPQLQMPSTTLP